MVAEPFAGVARDGETSSVVLMTATFQYGSSVTTRTDKTLDPKSKLLLYSQPERGIVLQCNTPPQYAVPASGVDLPTK